MVFDSLSYYFGGLLLVWWAYAIVSLFVFLCSSAKVSFVFKKYDGWIGFYHDNAKRRLYVLIVPFIGYCVDFSPPERLVKRE